MTSSGKFQAWLGCQQLTAPDDNPPPTPPLTMSPAHPSCIPRGSPTGEMGATGTVGFLSPRALPRQDLGQALCKHPELTIFMTECQVASAGP